MDTRDLKRLYDDYYEYLKRAPNLQPLRERLIAVINLYARMGVNASVDAGCLTSFSLYRAAHSQKIIAEWTHYPRGDARYEELSYDLADLSDEGLSTLTQEVEQFEAAKAEKIRLAEGGLKRLQEDLEFKTFQRLAKKYGPSAKQ